MFNFFKFNIKFIMSFPISYGNAWLFSNDKNYKDYVKYTTKAEQILRHTEKPYKYSGIEPKFEYNNLETNCSADYSDNLLKENNIHRKIPYHKFNTT